MIHGVHHATTIVAVQYAATTQAMRASRRR
jgi:hypothetical protein